MADMLDPTLLFDAATDTATLTLQDADGQLNTITLPGALLPKLLMSASAATCRRHPLKGPQTEGVYVHGLHSWSAHRIPGSNALVLDFHVLGDAMLRMFVGHTPTPEMLEGLAHLWNMQLVPAPPDAVPPPKH